jgi:hypothetical protein
MLMSFGKKLGRKKALGRSGRILKENIKINLKRWQIVEWINLVQNGDQSRAFAKTEINLQFP